MHSINTQLVVITPYRCSNFLILFHSICYALLFTQNVFVCVWRECMILRHAKWLIYTLPCGPCGPCVGSQTIPSSEESVQSFVPSQRNSSLMHFPLSHCHSLSPHSDGLTIAYDNHFLVFFI